VMPMVPSFDLDPLTSIVAQYWGHFMRKTHFVHRPIFAQNLGDRNVSLTRTEQIALDLR
jgi:hypothetical protein